MRAAWLTSQTPPPSLGWPSDADAEYAAPLPSPAADATRREPLEGLGDGGGRAGAVKGGEWERADAGIAPPMKQGKRVHGKLTTYRSAFRPLI